MKTFSINRFVILLAIAFGSFLLPCSIMADELVTITATSTDISENLDLKTVATLFGQAKDLEQFEHMLNNPDSAFSNLDLNGDGDVDYLRVMETAEDNRHLVVIQAILAKDIYQDVASIYVEKDENEQITVQVIGDEYIYGENYIIEPVYIYRPMIYDWFWGASWVCWHSPCHWGLWPVWWRPYACIDPFMYWDHCYWYHYHYPHCSYRTVHHHHPHYAAMHKQVSRNDFATRHPERSFVTRNASRNISNARALDQSRRTSMREAAATRTTQTSTRINPASTRGRNTAVRGTQSVRNTTYGSSNVRHTTTTNHSTTTTSRNVATRTAAPTSIRTNTSNRVTKPTYSTSTTRTSSVGSSNRTQSSGTTVRTSSTPSRTSSPQVRSTSTPSPTRSSSSVVRSTSMPTRSSGSMASPGGARSGGGSSRGGGTSTRR